MTSWELYELSKRGAVYRTWLFDEVNDKGKVSKKTALDFFIKNGIGWNDANELWVELIDNLEGDYFYKDKAVHRKQAHFNIKASSEDVKPDNVKTYIPTYINGGSPSEASTLRRKVYHLAVKGYRMSLMAQELFPTDCKTDKGYYNAQKRVKYHIDELVKDKYLKAHLSLKGRMVGFQRGRKYREFEQLYIVEGLDPSINPRVGSSTLHFEIHHIRGYCVVNVPPIKPLMYYYDKEHSGVPHRIANFVKQPQRSTDTKIPDDLPDFKILYRDGQHKKSFSIYVNEPVDVKDRRTLIQHEDMIEQSLLDIRAWLMKSYYCDLTEPTIQTPTHYAFPVPKGVAEELKRRTDQEQSKLYGDTSNGRAHAELRDKVLAGEIALLPDTLNDLRGEMRRIRETKHLEGERLEEIELTIKEMGLTIIEMAEKQTQLITMLGAEPKKEKKPEPPAKPVADDDGWRWVM